MSLQALNSCMYPAKAQSAAMDLAAFAAAGVGAWDCVKPLAESPGLC